LDKVGKSGNVLEMTREDRYNKACEITGGECLSWEEFMPTADRIYTICSKDVNASNVISEITGLTDKEDLLLLDRLDSVIDNLLVKVENGEEVTPALYGEEMDKFVSYVYANYEVKIDEENDSSNFAGAVVAMCYVSKYSFSYWYESIFNETHPWYGFLVSLDDNNNTKTCRWCQAVWHAIKVGAADTWGFVVGAVQHATPGNNGGPLIIDLDAAIDQAGRTSASVH